jgi:hypothetical protein
MKVAIGLCVLLFVDFALEIYFIFKLIYLLGGLK